MSAENRHSKVIMTKSNFTLVEVLAVMGLMAILLFMALPAFEKIAKGNGVEIAARTLSGKLGAARGYAINNRQYVAVLMPTDDLPDTYLYRSYKLCVVSKTSSSVTTGTSPNKITVTTFMFERWLPSENWGFLPTGAAINHIGITDSATKLSPHSLGSSSNNWAASTAREEVDGVKLYDIKPSYAVDNVRAIVFKPNGKLAGAGESRYVAVSESTYSGTILATTNQKNWIDITIDQYTGRVTYGAE
jgi:type II secretory pathway pseudopilin PulG